MLPLCTNNSGSPYVKQPLNHFGNFICVYWPGHAWNWRFSWSIMIKSRASIWMRIFTAYGCMNPLVRESLVGTVRNWFVFVRFSNTNVSKNYNWSNWGWSQGSLNKIGQKFMGPRISLYRGSQGIITASMRLVSHYIRMTCASEWKMTAIRLSLGGQSEWFTLT